MSATAEHVFAIPRLICAPTRKQVYLNLVRADRFRERLEIVTGRPYRVYRCERCGYFHLTSHGRRAWRS